MSRKEVSDEESSFNSDSESEVEDTEQEGDIDTEVTTNVSSEEDNNNKEHHEIKYRVVEPNGTSKLNGKEIKITKKDFNKIKEDLNDLFDERLDPFDREIEFVDGYIVISFDADEDDDIVDRKAVDKTIFYDFTTKLGKKVVRLEEITALEKKKGTNKAITPVSRKVSKNAPKTRKLEFTYTITDENNEGIVPTKKEITAMKESVETELEKYDGVTIVKITSDSDSISVVLTLSLDNQEKAKLPWYVQHEINSFELKPSKRVIKIFLQNKGLRYTDENGNLDIGIGNEEEFIFYITKDDDVPKEITDKDEKAILRQIRKYFRELNENEDELLPTYIEVDRAHNTVVMGVVEAIGYLDDTNIENELVNWFIDNRLALSELDPANQTHKSSDKGTILTLVVLYISEWRSGQYYFVDEDLLKGKYSDVYKSIKNGDKDNSIHVLKILNKINVKDKLDDPDFKYRIGERLSADF